MGDHLVSGARNRVLRAIQYHSFTRGVCFFPGYVALATSGGWHVVVDCLRRRMRPKDQNWTPEAPEHAAKAIMEPPPIIDISDSE